MKGKEAYNKKNNKERLNILGSFNDVLKVSVPKDEKKKETKIDKDS